MSLALLVGPANAGKVATLLDRYVAALDRGPMLLVPNRREVDRIERDLLTRAPALLGGWIGTFADLAEELAGRDGRRPVIGRLQRALLVSGVVEGADLQGLAASARFGGFAEALSDSIAELESALVEPEDVPGPLGRLYGAYRAELDRLGLWDHELLVARAAGRVAGELTAWDGRPVFLYGFEDLSGAQWALLEALAGRSEVCVSLPYEPGRLAFSALERTANGFARLAGAAVEELPPKSWYDSPALAHLERALFEGGAGSPPSLDGAVRFLEAAGPRAALELVGDEVLSLVRGGTPAEDIGIVVPSLERVMTSLETSFGPLGIPYTLRGAARIGRTPFGRSLVGLLRFAWLGGGRRELFAFLRSPYSGLSRARVDFLEGRLRGRAVSLPARVEEETVRLLGDRIVQLDGLREALVPATGVRVLAARMLATAWGVTRPPVGAASELDLRAEQAVRRVVDEAEAWREHGGAVDTAELVRALEHGPMSLRAPEDGRVVVLDLLQARTRRFGVVFVLGLEEGVLPRRAIDAPFLDETIRAELEANGHRLTGTDEVARDRYLFYTACTRAWRRLVLVREAATDDGRPLEPSPFYEEVRGLFSPTEVERWTRRRPLSDLAWELHLAPTDRERLRSVAALAAEDPVAARSLAAAGGWSRQIERALAAFSRPTGLANPAVLGRLGEQDRFSVTELELFGDCSSMWLIDRVVEPKTIDGEVDARLRGQVAHQALYRFYAGLPRRMGVDTADAGRVDEAVEFLLECLDEAIASQVRIEASELDLLELRSTLARDLEHFLRQDVALGFPLVPRRFEVSFGSARSAPELQRGLDLGGFTVSGKIDRIDVDPFSARGIVQDYKSGVAHSARQIEADARLQVPFYALALRDLVGMEPLGGLYRSLSGEREARGIVRADARAAVPGIAEQDYVEEEAFWGHVERAVARARAAVERLRAGDVRHNPRWPDGCPAWCDNWPMCRVERP